MAELPKGIYRHYKGKLYELFECNALHSETFEDLVLYRATFNCSQWGRHRVWAKPKKIFLEEVRHLGQDVPRFKYFAKTLEEALSKINKGID